MKDTLIIFARTPELGRVKKRLAADLGDQRALAAHEELLQRVITQTSGGDYQVDLWLTSLSKQLPAWLSDAASALHEQGVGDLGQRMQQAMTPTLTDGRRCVLVGSDCPGIDRDYVLAAFAALQRSEVVFGPAEDGGYGLVGMKRLVPEVFAEEHWGDARVLERARARAISAGASVALLPEIYDVDTPSDWQRYKRESGEGGDVGA